MQSEAQKSGGTAGLTSADAPATQARSAQQRAEWLGIAILFAQLVLVALVLKHLDILTPAFRRVFYLASVGFVIHHFLPKQYRLWFFNLFSIGVLFVVLGGSADHRFLDFGQAVARTVPLVLAGCGLISICLLPIRFWQRLIILGVAVVGVGLLRKGIIGSDSLLLLWPLLASLFMFRLIVFLYDLATWKVRPKWSEAIAYFFLFPNFCSALFPVVDFKTMCQSQYNAGAMLIYERGARWIVRGVLQLFAHRLIVQLFSLQPEYISNGTDLIQFILTSTFVYLQVSGLFHFVVGMLLLFGFNLPETNQRYFLASSFTDYWRRVNIYWKNFIMKVVYYPAYFRLKNLGGTTALVISTLWAFFITWALHLYQTWWLKGFMGFSWSDVLFWSTLAVLVLANSLWEMKRGRQRKLSSGYSFRSALGLAARTGGTFACISLLWSLWSTSSVTQWIGLWRHADMNTLLWGLAALASIMIAAIVFEVMPANRKARPAAASQSSYSVFELGRSLAAGTAVLVVLLLVQRPAFQERFESVRLQPWYDAINTGDTIVALDRQLTDGGGYYARLVSVDRADQQLWETLLIERLPNMYQGATASQPVRDFRFDAPIPSVKMQAYETEFETNPYGMRDRNYTQAKPPRTVRIALLGSSHTMGYGVIQEQTFASLIEERLNMEPPPGAQGITFEVLNFAFSRLSPLGQITVMDQVSVFHPDVVLFISHSLDYEWVSYDLARCLRERVPIPYQIPTEVLRAARITAHTPRHISGWRLKPYQAEMLAWACETIVERCHRIGALPVAVFVPLPNDLANDNLSNATKHLNLLVESGFVSCDFSRLYEGLRIEDVALPEPLHHSNARAHRLIADALYRSLLTDTNINLAYQIQKVSEALSETRQPGEHIEQTRASINKN